MIALIHHGASVNEKNNDGETPLHRAARGPYHPKPDSQGKKRKTNERVSLDNYLNAVTCLIENCANRYIKDRNGRTPLDIAIVMSGIYPGYERIIGRLKSL